MEVKAPSALRKLIPIAYLRVFLTTGAMGFFADLASAVATYFSRKQLLLFAFAFIDEFASGKQSFLVGIYITQLEGFSLTGTQRTRRIDHSQRTAFSNLRAICLICLHGRDNLPVL